MVSLPAYGQAQTWVTVEKDFDLQRWTFSIGQRVQTSWYHRTSAEDGIDGVDYGDEIDFVDDVFSNIEYDDLDDLYEVEQEEDEEMDPGTVFSLPGQATQEPEPRRQLMRSALRGRTALEMERTLGRRWDFAFYITYTMRPGTNVGSFRTGVERTFRPGSLRIRIGAYYQGQMGMAQARDYRSATRFRVYATRPGTIAPVVQSEVIQRLGDNTLRTERLRFQAGLRIRISQVHRLSLGYRMQYRIAQSAWTGLFRAGYTIRL